MNKYQWEEKFCRWAQPPSKTETERCDNAVSVIRKALEASEELAIRPTRIFVQGSYKNRTNVSSDSDVDIGIAYDGSTFLADYPEGMTREDFGFSPGSYEYTQFKNEVERALVSYFGRTAVHRGNKAFDISENSYRVEADVAAFFEYRWYTRSGAFKSGVALLPDDGSRKIINWPDQHYDNGVSKNSATGRRFKALVRIIKKLRNVMEKDGYESTGPLIGFFNECLIWNAPNNIFGTGSYYDDLRAVIVFLYENTKSSEKCDSWCEVSELKYLFRKGRTGSQVATFLNDAWSYVGFK